MENEAVHEFQHVTLGDLGHIRLFVRETAVSWGCPSAEIAEFVVAVDEAAANIIRHGYKNQPETIKIIMRFNGATLTVMLCDQAPPFDPTLVANPDTSLPLEKRPFGGLGVHMMRTFCDEMVYHRNLYGENQLTLSRQLSPSKTQQAGESSTC